jgi:anti-sigma factor RsiW
MINRDAPVTTEELHAFVDGMLPMDRQDAVEAWLAAHPNDAAQVDAWRAQADAIRAHLGAPASEPVPARFDLDKLALASTRRPWRSIAAAAAIAALIGGLAGWMMHDAVAAVTPPTSFDTYTSEALDAHKLYVVEVRHPVEVPGEEHQHLAAWLSKRLDYQLRIPNLASLGLKLVGGRLLPGPTGAASAFFMYETPSGDRFTIYCAKSHSPETGMRYREADRFSSFYWTDQGLAYVVSGPADRQRLWAVVKVAYDQTAETPWQSRSKQ